MQPIIDTFEQYAQQVPLELFVLVGTFIEELFSPIPSFAVLVPAGAAAAVQGFGVLHLLVLVLCSALGRIAGAAIIYSVADKLEDRFLTNGRRFFGLSHTEIEQFGQRMTQAGRRSWILLFCMNALPIFPAAMLSLACGFIKVPFRIFLFCSFFGTMINAALYLSIGYAGFRTAETLHTIEIASQVVIGLLIVGVIAWLVHRRRNKKSLLARQISAKQPKN